MVLSQPLMSDEYPRSTGDEVEHVACRQDPESWLCNQIPPNMLPVFTPHRPPAFSIQAVHVVDQPAVGRDPQVLQTAVEATLSVLPSGRGQLDCLSCWQPIKRWTRARTEGANQAGQPCLQFRRGRVIRKREDRLARLKPLQSRTKHFHALQDQRSRLLEGQGRLVGVPVAMGLHDVTTGLQFVPQPEVPLVPAARSRNHVELGAKAKALEQLGRLERWFSEAVVPR